DPHRYYNTSRFMTTVAILGAGDLGGAVAQALAARDRVARVVLIDPGTTVAAGKALDIQQSGAVHAFHAKLTGTDDLSRAAGAAGSTFGEALAARTVHARARRRARD